jgi:hypothetical protein
MFFGLWLIFMAVASFLKDAQDRPYGLFGSYVWGLAFLLSFFLFLLYLLQFVLPLPWYLSLKEGLILIVHPTFYYVSKLFRGLLPRSAGEVAPEELLADLPPGFEEHRAGIVPSYQALATTRGPKYERSVGPGYVRLKGGETVTQVVDLRRQARGLTVKAMTRDGIPIETDLNVTFQVKMQPSSNVSTLPYPYDPEAIFGVNYLSSYRSENGILDWGERITRAAADILIGELAQYALEDFYQPVQVSFSPRKRIVNRMEQKLSSEFESKGVTILGASAGQLTVPDEVVGQLISNWQTEWQRKIDEIEAATETTAMQRRKLAEARAETEIIATITESIQAMQSSGAGQLADTVTIRMLEAMREAAEDEQVKAMVPSQALDTMRQLQGWLLDSGADR